MEEIEKYVVVNIAKYLEKSRRRIASTNEGQVYNDVETVMIDLLEPLTVKAMNQIDGEAEFDHVITVTGRCRRPEPYNHDDHLAGQSVVPHDTSSSFNRFLQESEIELDNRAKLRIQTAIADALGIFDEDEDGITLRRFLKCADDLDYYQYLYHGVEMRGLLHHLAEKIYTKLRSKRYLLLIRRNDTDIKVDDVISMGLPPPNMWNKSWWFITYYSSTIPQANEVYLNPFIINDGEVYRKGIIPLQASRIPSSLFHIGGNVNYTDVVKMVLDCCFYSSLFIPQSNAQYTKSDLKRDMELVGYGIQEDELVKYWIEDGIMTRLLDTNRKIIAEQQQENGLEADDDDEDLFDIGKVILEQMVTRSMLVRKPPPCSSSFLFQDLLRKPPPFSSSFPFQALGREPPPFSRQLWERPYIVSEGVCGSFPFQDLVRKLYLSGETLPYPVELLSMPPVKVWEDKKHLSFIRISWIRVRLPSEYPLRCTKLTTLIFRACIGLPEILDGGLLRHMPCLRVLDLSYSDLIFLPSSLFCLENLRLLSLRGCHKLENLATSPSFPSQSLRVLPRLRVLDLSCQSLVSLRPTIDVPELRELLLEGCSSLSSDHTSPFLESLIKLRVLRLTWSQIVAFQEATFGRMERLRVLDLSNNSSLVSLPASLSNAKHLEEVHVSGCKALEDLKAIRSAKLRRFSFFDNYSLTILPDPFNNMVVLEEIRLQDCRALKGIDAIGGCARLRILSLTNITHLKSLPESFSKLCNLEELYIAKCKGLHSIDLVAHDKLRVLSLVNNVVIRSLPEWVRRAQVLQELRLENCRALKEIDMEGDCTNNIKSFFLSGSPIVELSLKSCKNLDTITLLDLLELEVLDLSFTGIRELPAEIFRLPKLRRFDMLAARNLRRFPWHAVPQVPGEFNLDNCSDILDAGRIPRSSRVFVHDPRFFCSLTAEAAKRLLGSKVQFHVHISKKSHQLNTAVTSTTKEAAAAAAAAAGYRHILVARENLLNKDAYRRPNHEICRRLTMEGIDEFPYRPFPLLDCIDSLSVRDDRSLDSLADLSPMGSLKECELEQCHNIEYAFEADKTRQQGLLTVLRVSGLRKLTVLCRRRGVGSADTGGFRSLQHLHLDHCWRLESIFPAGFDLPSLETLTVKFCDSLREIFFGGGGQISDNVLPKLSTVCLWELPKLLHFSGGREVVTPELKELNVRGCWRLYRLPLIAATTDADANVADVGGEQEWWNRLIWDHYRIDGRNVVVNRRIRFKARPRFASSVPTVRGRIRRSMTKR